MADTPWINERETGRWYVWAQGLNGPERRYSTELEQPAYQSPNPNIYQQQQYHVTPQSSRGYDGRILQSSNSLSAVSPQLPGVPRYDSSGIGQSPYTSSGQSQYVAVSGPSSYRPERENTYFESGGYDQGSTSGSGLATYSNVQISSGRTAALGYDPAYDPNGLAATTSKLSINEFGPSTNFRLSHSPPQPQHQYAAPPTRGRGQAQSRGQGPATRARSQSRHGRYIGPTEGNTEQLDSSYRMRNTDWKKFFECGRVFKTLWTDPAGPEDASELSQFMSKARYKVAHGEYVYSKIRRFVVVSRHGYSCQCLPVTTYDGKGYRKRNIKLAEHGLIYTGNRAPDPVPGINLEPLYIKDAAETLATSYINYGRSYSVDTNVKVKNVGFLDGQSRRLLRKYYRAIHFPSDDEDSPPPPPPPPSNERRSARETEVLGVGSGLPLSSSPKYRAQYHEAAPVASSRPFSGQAEPVYQDTEYRTKYSNSSRPVQETTYPTSSSSRPRIVQPRRDSETDLEIDLEEDLPRKTRRESNAGGERRRHR